VSERVIPEKKHRTSFTAMKVFSRAARRKGRTVRVTAYPKEAELARWAVAQKQYGFWSISELVTEAVNSMALKRVPYIVVLDGDLAVKAETMAKDLQYTGAEEWITESVRASIDAGWKAKTQVIPPDER